MSGRSLPELVGECHRIKLSVGMPMEGTCLSETCSDAVRDGGLGDDGFTLIELMVALLILTILLAIAIPTFLGTSNAANDRGAQQNLNTTLVDSNTLFQTNDQSFGLGATAQYKQFGGNMATSLAGDEPSLGFTTSNSSSPSNISLNVSGGGNRLVLANRSPSSGTCWHAIEHPLAISTINKASSTAPYGATATMTNNPGKASATKIVFPTAAGTWYAEVTRDTTAADCSASAPKFTGTGSEYQIAQSSFLN